MRSAIIGGVLLLSLSFTMVAELELPSPEWDLIVRGEPTISVSVRGIEKIGQVLPSLYACDGEGRIPTIKWEAVPNAKSYLVIVYDPDAPMGTFYHLVGVVPASTTMIDNQTQWTILGHNSGGKPGWFPLCPPPFDKPHRYYFLVVALNYVPKQLPAYEAFPKILKDKVVGWGWTMGTYKR